MAAAKATKETKQLQKAIMRPREAAEAQVKRKINETDSQLRMAEEAKVDAVIRMT